MDGLERFGIGENLPPEKLLDRLQRKQTELLERLDNVEDENRRAELEAQHEELEELLLDAYERVKKKETGLFRDDSPEDLAELKGERVKPLDLRQCLQPRGFLLAQFREIGNEFARHKYGKIDQLMELAKGGLDKAQVLLGFCYEKGYGVEKDWAKAAKWYEEAAEQGEASGTGWLYLGRLYENGWGVEKSGERAVELYEKAAEKNNAEAAVGLGNLYFNGTAVERNEAQAFGWYEKAADLGCTGAMEWTGYLYETGKGVEQNFEMALKWYQKATDKGSCYGQNKLGAMYHYGKGVPVDYKKAVACYREAAMKAFAPAQYNMGLMYEKGLGVPADREEARKWYQKAADNGAAEARKALERIGV